MKVKQFSVAPSTLGAIATAVKMRRLGGKYINVEQFAKLCQNIGEEFISDLATDDKFMQILAVAARHAAETAEHAEVQL